MNFLAASGIELEDMSTASCLHMSPPQHMEQNPSTITQEKKSMRKLSEHGKLGQYQLGKHKPNTNHQHSQLSKHQLGTHKPNIWAGGTREAIKYFKTK